MIISFWFQLYSQHVYTALNARDTATPVRGSTFEVK